MATNIHQAKAAALRSLMNDPKVSAQVLDGVGAPVGSTRRVRAGRHLKVVDMAARSHAARHGAQGMDGQGGPGISVTDPNKPIEPNPLSPPPQPIGGTPSPALSPNPQPLGQITSIAPGFNLPTTPNMTKVELDFEGNAAVTKGPKKQVKRYPDGSMRVIDYTNPTTAPSALGDWADRSFEGAVSPDSSYGGAALRTIGGTAAKAADLIGRAGVFAGDATLKGLMTAGSAMAGLYELPFQKVGTGLKYDNYFSSPFGGSQPAQLGHPVTAAAQAQAATGYGPTQAESDAIKAKAEAENLKNGMDPETASAEASYTAFSATGFSPTGAGASIGSWEGMQESPSNAEKWFAGLSAADKAKYLPLMEAWRNKQGGDAYAMGVMGDAKKLSEITGLPPEVIARWPIDAVSGANYQKLSEAYDRQHGIAKLEDDLLNNGTMAGLSSDLGRQYIKKNDQFAQKLDGMLRDFNADSAYADTSSPLSQQMRGAYGSYLQSLKTDQVNRYSAVLNESSAMSQANFQAYSSNVAKLLDKASEEKSKMYADTQNAYANVKKALTDSYAGIDGMAKAAADEMDAKVRMITANTNYLTAVANASLLPDQIENQRLALEAQNAFYKSGGGVNDKTYNIDALNKYAFFGGAPGKSTTTGKFIPGQMSQLQTPEDIRNYAKTQQWGSGIQAQAIKDYGGLLAQQMDGEFDAGNPMEFLDSFIAKLGAQKSSDPNDNLAYLQSMLNGVPTGISAYFNNKDQGGAVTQKLAKDMNKGKDAAYLHAQYDSKLGYWAVDSLIKYDQFAKANIQPVGTVGAFFDKNAKADGSKDAAAALNAAKGAVKFMMNSKAQPFIMGAGSPKAEAGPTAGATVTGGDLPTSGRYATKSPFRVPAGTVYGKGWRTKNVGECGSYLNDFTGLGVGDTLQSKVSKMDRSLKPEAVRAGDVFTQNVGPHGHVGFVNAIGRDKSGRLVFRMSESNYYENSKPGQVTHDREVYADDPSLVGFRHVGA